MFYLPLFYAVNLMASQCKGIHKWTIRKFDSIFDQITKLSYADDLLSGIKHVILCMHIILVRAESRKWR